MWQIFLIDDVPSDVSVDTDSAMSYHTGLQELSVVISVFDVVGNFLKCPYYIHTYLSTTLCILCCRSRLASCYWPIVQTWVVKTKVPEFNWSFPRCPPIHCEHFMNGEPMHASVFVAESLTASSIDHSVGTTVVFQPQVCPLSPGLVNWNKTGETVPLLPRVVNSKRGHLYRWMYYVIHSGTQILEVKLHFLATR